MDNKKPNIIALIVAAGSGERFGGALPKQYLPLLGRSVLGWSLDIYGNHPEISAVGVVIHPDHKGLATIPDAIHGGATRQESVLKGLEGIAPLNPDFVLIHDAARPGITPELVSRVIASLKDAEAVVPGLPVADTLRRAENGSTKTVSRDNLYAIQTPQAFKFKTILDLHHQHKDKSLTDDAALCEASGIPVAIVSGDRGNFKVTHLEDFALMEQALASRCGDLRTGTGYDVHCLIEQPGRPLMLCGIEVPHPLTLEGHSDADVGLHAITDAILGAICDGDIGVHFSPKNPKWKDADSAQFLQDAVARVAAQGGVLMHIDVTLVCEEPKIGPHRDTMRKRIGEITNLPLSRVSVKAKTTEGLGFTGRKEGIAAEAVATVRLPFSAVQEQRKWGT